MTITSIITGKIPEFGLLLSFAFDLLLCDSVSQPLTRPEWDRGVEAEKDFEGFFRLASSLKVRSCISIARDLGHKVHGDIRRHSTQSLIV